MYCVGKFLKKNFEMDFLSLRTKWRRKVRGGHLEDLWMASEALVMCPGGANLARVLEWVPGSPKKSLTASQSDREAGKAKKHARRTRYCPKWQFGIFTIFRVTVRTVVGGWKFFYGQIPPGFC